MSFVLSSHFSPIPLNLRLFHTTCRSYWLNFLCSFVIFKVSFINFSMTAALFCCSDILFSPCLHLLPIHLLEFLVSWISIWSLIFLWWSFIFCIILFSNVSSPWMSSMSSIIFVFIWPNISSYISFLSLPNALLICFAI